MCDRAVEFVTAGRAKVAAIPEVCELRLTPADDECANEQREDHEHNRDDQQPAGTREQSDPPKRRAAAIL